MLLSRRLSSLALLGDYLKKLPAGTQETLFRRARVENPWFTPSQLALAWEHLGNCLSLSTLRAWVARYTWPSHPLSPKRVGLVMAGNIPAVGFHDVLCVLVAGHKAHLMPSSKDGVLIRFLVEHLVRLEPAWQPYLSFPRFLKGVEALIATGRWQTYHHFKRYFAHVPHIIRHERSSCAVLSGEESEEALRALGRDVFTFFGLGCRSVSKLYVPAGYAIAGLFDCFEPFREMLTGHAKYVNNYDYYRTTYAIEGVPYQDNGFFLLRRSEGLSAPLAVLFYEEYTSFRDLVARLGAQREVLQIAVAGEAMRTRLSGAEALAGLALVGFGAAQQPALSDYADGTDTLNFLQSIGENR